MSISPSTLYPPQPSTTRAQSLHISYDAVNDRIAYPNGKSIIVRPLDPQNSSIPVKQFTKHTHPTTVATFSPSGNYIASGDESGQVKIWDTAVVAQEGNEFEQPYIKSEFQILAGPIKSIAWDADNSRVIAVGQGKDKFGHCFTWDSGNSIGEIQGHSSTINAVAIKSQRPYRAATVGEDKALVFFNGPPFKFDKSVRGYHTNTIRDVKFSPDGKWLVSVGSDRIIAIYDGKTGEYVKSIEDAHKGGIFGVSWFADSTKFVTASADGTLKSWKAETIEPVSTYVVDETASIGNQQVGVVVSKNYIVSLSFNGNLNYFKENVTELDKVISGHQNPLTALALKDNTLITGSSDGALFQWTLEKGAFEPVPQVFGQAKDKHGNYVVSILAEENVVTSGWDDKIKVWDKEIQNLDLEGQPKQVKASGEFLIVLFENKIELYTKDLKKVGSITLAFNSNDMDVFGDKVLITNTSSNKVEEYVVENGSFTATSTKYPQLRSPPSLIRISPDGKYAAVADNTGKYTLYNTSDASVVTTRWAFHSNKVYDSKWTKDSKFIISGGLDGGLFLYSVEKPSKVLKFPLAHQSGVSGVEWLEYNHDEKKGSFATIGLDGVLKKWNIDMSVY